MALPGAVNLEVMLVFVLVFIGLNRLFLYAILVRAGR
ncbi:hypothetical protein FH603_2891 [Spirosoma sp. LMG 31447]|uniref:Uncharacterized protein n=1 Tax=Spirosoma utsteinense TaxID=2585773 RepID=A0ABR6W806_9BACT|nr:hypothetical protein [Spirosoma utsteinense]